MLLGHNFDERMQTIVNNVIAKEIIKCTDCGYMELTVFKPELFASDVQADVMQAQITT